MKRSLGEVLKELRINRRLSQEELAENLNQKFGSSVNKGMISKWENGLGEPRLETVRNLSVFYDIPLDELLGIEPSELSPKEERDIAIDLENMMEALNSQQSLAFHGESLDEETKELMRISLENSMRLAKQLAKQKFNPNKNKK